MVRRNGEFLPKGGGRGVEPPMGGGKEKLPPVDEVVESVIDSLAPRDMIGMRVLVTSGPTREHIDATKYVTTPSSGLTGYYMSREAAARGASVTVVSGPVGVRYPPNVTVKTVTSVLDMYDAVMNELKAVSYDFVILTAAPLDFYVANREKGKLDSSMERVFVEMKQAPKIARDVKRVSPGSFLIGFKAEVGIERKELVERAIKRMREGNWDMALAHDVGGSLGFGSLLDSYLIIHGSGEVREVGPMSKRELSRLVLTEAVKLRSLRFRP